MFILPAGGLTAQHQVARSIRGGSNAYFTRTFGADPVTRTKCGISFWYKRGGVGVNEVIFGGRGSANGTYCSFRTDNGKLQVVAVDTSSVISTNAFTDMSVWKHFVISYDSTQATAANRVLVWVNGVAETLTGTQPTLNALHHFCLANSANRIGSLWDGTLGFFMQNYLADFHFIDGLTVTATQFAQSGGSGWIPKPFTGTYGTNGFKLDFADNSALTAAALGNDVSGNNNDWTPVLFSLAADVNNDSLFDSPTYRYGIDTGAGGEVHGNYCTLDPVDHTFMGSTNATPLNGGLTIIFQGSAPAGAIRATKAVSSGKWYWEVGFIENLSGIQFGILGPGTTLTSSSGLSIGSLSDGYVVASSNGLKWNNNTSAAYTSAFPSSGVLGVALDLTNGTLVFYLDGVSLGTAYSGLSGSFKPALSGTDSCSATINFGQRPFTYPAPSGFAVLCT